MNQPIVFTGGWLDLAGLLRGLRGRPLQADTEEVFTPGDGGPSQRRPGRVLVDRQRRIRLDAYQDGAPPAMFLFDPGRRLMMMGVVDQPDSWRVLPWAFPLPPVPDDRDAEPRPVAIDMEVEAATGRYRYRVFNARYDDPDEAWFPDPSRIA